MITDKTFAPRRWQSDGLSAFKEWRDNRRSGDSRTFTAAITGGAGKTHFGSMIAKYLFEEKEIDNIVVIDPSNTISMQWMGTLAEHDILLDTFHPDRAFPDTDTLTTYHMMNNHAGKLTRMINRRTLVIFDECHHLADSASWGDAARLAAKDAGYRLMLTATPFREDDAKIPYVTYKDGLLVTNFEYSYGDALDDKHVRPVYFKALDADSTWRQDGNLSGWSFNAEKVKHNDFFGIINAAIDPDSGWLKALITDAHAVLEDIRLFMPDAGGIITCRDQSHARQIQRLMQKITKTNPVLAISDDPDSDEKIDKFRDSNTEWLVVVRKGSEGLNIPRLCVGIWATNITKQLSFLQFLLRLVRTRDEHRIKKAYFFMPAHPLLIEYANSIREMRVHALNEKQDNPEQQSRTSSEKRLAFEAIASEPGAITEIEYSNHPTDTLEILIQLREYAAGAIDDYARFQSEVSLNAAMYDIRNLLNVPIRQVEDKPAISPVDEYEYERQWRAFLVLFNDIKVAQNWWRDVLSLLYREEEIPLTGDYILTNVPGASKRLFRDNRTKENVMIEIGLIAYEKGNYLSRISSHLQTIAPDHDTEKLVGYLLNGQLPERKNNGS